MRILVSLLALATFLVSCTPWVPMNKPYSREFDFGKDLAWRGLMDYFTKHDIQIKTIEKDSGVVYAEKQFAASDILTLHADCGLGLGVNPNDIGSVSFNAFVIEDEPNESKVTINASFTQPVLVYTGFANVPQNRQCNSNGKLEEGILNYIENFNY